MVLNEGMSIHEATSESQPTESPKKDYNVVDINSNIWSTPNDTKDWSMKTEGTNKKRVLAVAVALLLCVFAGGAYAISKTWRSKQAVEQPGKQAVEQPGKQAVEQPGKQAVEQPGKQAVEQPGKQAGGEKEWVEKWLESPDTTKGRQFDFETGMDFIKNTKLTSIFSTYCSETNILLQASAGEYGGMVKGQAITYMDNLVSKLRNMDKTKVRSSMRAYIPVDRDDLGPEQGDEDTWRRYSSDDVEKLLTEHNEWVWVQTNGKIPGNLKRNVFEGYPQNRVYVSVFWFKDQWAVKFLPEHTMEDEFHLMNGGTVKKSFMNRFDEFRHKLYREIDHPFDLVAVEYAGKEPGKKSTRFMVYLIPKEKTADLGEVWKSLCDSAENGIGELLYKKCNYEFINLSVPKIVTLRSRLDLKEILRNTYGGGPAGQIVKSVMDAYIDVDEEGTEAAAVVSTCVAEGPVSTPVLKITANKPYIAFVYDTNLDRVLFVVKDTGEISQ